MTRSRIGRPLPHRGLAGGARPRVASTERRGSKGRRPAGRWWRDWRLRGEGNGGEERGMGDKGTFSRDRNIVHLIGDLAQDKRLRLT